MSATELQITKGGTYAKVVADSVGPTGDRVTSFEVRFHRFVLAEVNTHAAFSRNSASSRAIPVGKQLERFASEPAYPVAWPAEQKGMSGGPDLEGEDLDHARRLFGDWRNTTLRLVQDYVASHPDAHHRLHKSLINRLMEPMQWHTALITAASWHNFFDQRCSPAAQPELRVVAEMMRDLYMESTPEQLKRGQWHLPYLHPEETVGEGQYLHVQGRDTGIDARMVSAARCARLSYLTQSGERSLQDDLDLFDRLVTMWHWSPLEHLATPWEGNVHFAPVIDPDSRRTLADIRLPRLGKFPGWMQYRHLVEAQQGYLSYR